MKSKASKTGPETVGRLTERDLQALLYAFDNVLTPFGPVQVLLFGSRADMAAKGGDIDLLISLTRQPDTSLVWLTRRLRLAIFEQTEEQKIDIVWDYPGNESEFPALIRPNAVLIWKNEDAKPA